MKRTMREGATVLWMAVLIAGCCPTTKPVTADRGSDDGSSYPTDGSILHLKALHKGETCVTQDDCAPDLLCVHGYCAQVVSAKGGPCFVAQHCEPGLHCLDGKCSALLCGQVGQYCGSDDDCLTPGFCSYGTCAKGPEPVGGPCSYDTDCAQPAVCKGGVCEEKVLAKVDGPCIADADCIAGLMCVLGSCKEGPLAAGESCGTHAQCRPGLLCHAQACTPVGDGALAALCASPSDCKYGLDCFDDQCSRRLTLGNPCKFDEDCDANTMCVMGKCSASLVPDGGACALTMDCASDFEISVCIKGKCSPIGHGAKGEICEIDEDCREPLVCNAYQCASKYAKKGQPCFEDEHCDDGYCVAGKCAADLLADGAKCQDDYDCESGLCILDTCVWDLKLLGQECEWDADCESGLCVSTRCVASGGTLSDPCTRDKDCELPFICIKDRCTDRLSEKGDPCGRTEDCLPGLSCKKNSCT